VAIERVATLLQQIGALSERGSLLDAYPRPHPTAYVPLRRSRIARVLGFSIEPAFVEETLHRLGFRLEPGSPDTGTTGWTVAVPPWRVDVSREVDLIEEAARHRGYDAIPATFPDLTAPPPPPDARLARAAQIRRVLTAAGFSEATTFTFIERGAAEAFAEEAAVVPIANPLSEKFAVLRPAMVPGVLDSAAHNRRRAVPDVRLFEVGSRFAAGAPEQRALGIVWVGAAGAEHWSSKPRPADFFDIKGVVSRLVESFGIEGIWTPASAKGFVDGQTAALTADADGGTIPIGTVGRIDPAVARERGLPDGDAALAAEIDLDALARAAQPRDDLHVRPLPRHPAVVRDLSLVLDEALPAVAVRGTIQAAAPATLAEVRVFDRYRGPGVPDGSISLSLHLVFRAADRTLTDAEVQSAVDGIMAALARTHGAKRR
jgi:phenylalanyl-tRNA synthetase beta chain